MATKRFPTTYNGFQKKINETYELIKNGQTDFETLKYYITLNIKCLQNEIEGCQNWPELVDRYNALIANWMQRMDYINKKANETLDL